MSQYDRPRMQVLVGGRELTDRTDSLVFSAVDRGGFEIATLGLPSADRPLKGTPVVIRYGLEVAWAGRVAEIADHSIHGRATKTTGCEGWQALLKDNPYSMVYVDRDLGQWKAPGVGRAISLAEANKKSGSFRAGVDQTTSLPALVQEISDDWADPWRPLTECWYDAGPGNLIGFIYYNLVLSLASGNWTVEVGVSPDDVLSNTRGTGNLNPGGAGYLTGVPWWRYAHAEFTYPPFAGGAAGAKYLAAWKNLAVYGNHGLNSRGPDPQGFYPSDIARHALAQTKGISGGVIVDSTGYIAPHVVYRTPTDPAVVIDDMAKLMGWPWGVWEPATILGSDPRFDFRPPPSDATAVVGKAECDELDITSRLGDLYDTCIVTYTDPAGTAGEATVKLSNPQLYEAGVNGRTLLMAAGTSSQAAAETLGNFALALSQNASRAAGQATLPAYVRLPGGGSKPACLLRPGIDRLRITDLIDGGPLFDQGTTRRDVFRIGRVETTVSKEGAPNTRVELDNGTNLIETLQARLALAAGVVGSGAG